MIFGLLGRGYKHRLLNFRDELWDRRLGVRTFGHIESHIEGGRIYGPASYASIRTTLDMCRPNEDDVFVDIGCGFGRPLFYLVNRFQVRRAIGVEANADFAQMARVNIANYRGKRANLLQIEEVLAQQFNFDQATYIYLYNPFGPEIMDDVLAVIGQSLRNHPRRLRIVYLNPIELPCFERCEWLQEVDRLYPDQVPSLAIGDRAAFPKGWPAVAVFEAGRSIS